MVIIADKMKKTVNDDTIQLILEIGSELNGILAYRINADEKVSRKTITLTIIERDYVREVIMLKILLIDIKNIIVRTENNRNIPYPAYLALCRNL